MKSQYVLEWSHKTNNFHIQPLENHLARNQEAFMGDEFIPDWKVLFVGTRDAVGEMADHWRDRIRERSTMRPLKEAI